MGLEIERKWLLENIPEWLCNYYHNEIIQGFLCTDPVIRVRKDGSSYYMTYKGRGDISRVEYNLPLNEDAFMSLLAKCDGLIIYKDRYCVPLKISDNGEIIIGSDSDLVYKAEVDIFHKEYDGLAFTEVEFTDMKTAQSFIAPSWFGREVTGVRGYTNAELSAIKK